MGIRVALSWVTLLLAAVQGVEESNLDQTSGGVAKKLVVKLWTHTDGAPMGHPVELHLPDGQREDVTELVAQKEQERAEAELHHAKVKETQLDQQNSEAHEQDQRAATQNKIALKAFKTATSTFDEAQKALHEADAKSAKATESYMEKKQALQFASAKAKTKALPEEQAAQKLKAASAEALTLAKEKSEEAEKKLHDVTQIKDEAQEKADSVHLEAVTVAVKLRAAMEHRERMELKSLKAKHMAKLSVDRRSRENWKKKVKIGKANVGRAQEFLNMMDSEDGKKSAQKAVDKANKALTEAEQKYDESKKAVAKTADELRKSVMSFQKKWAHRTFIKAAKASQVAADADKAFANALTKADRVAKEQTAREAKKFLKMADDAARKNMADYENAKFLGNQEIKAEKLSMAEEEQEAKDKKEKLEKEKEEQALAKKNLKGFGQAPK